MGGRMAQPRPNSSVFSFRAQETHQWILSLASQLPSIPHRRRAYAHPILRATPSPTKSSSERPTPLTLPGTFRSCSRDKRAGQGSLRSAAAGRVGWARGLGDAGGRDGGGRRGPGRVPGVAFPVVGQRESSVSSFLVQNFRAR
jgi:hypothetical protein